MAVGTAALVASTWPLWTPQRLPPRVPPLTALNTIPAVLDYLLLVALAVGVVVVLVAASWRRGLVLATACLAGLMLLDQLRWQPWAYQLLLLGIGLTLLPWPAARRWLRALLVSVYLYSAMAKLDVVFANTIGQQIIGAMLGLVGVEAESLPHCVRITLALAMPLAEAATGLLLSWPKNRRPGVVAACLLHGSLVVALGPLGLRHAAGVQLWNLVMATLTAAVFWPSKQSNREADVSSTMRPNVFAAWFARATLLVAITAPLTNAFGIWDRWPSWGLYAPRGERAQVLVHASVVDRLPAGMPLAPGDAWQKIRLDRWLLAETGAPLYPQNRAAVALAIALDDETRIGSYLRVRLDSPAGRLNADRDRLTLEGAEAVRDHAEATYWLNTKPRWTR